jgi:hypothetical protein
LRATVCVWGHRTWRSSWLQRAELAWNDHDAAFIFHWIAFNASCADELRATDAESERSVFADYFQRLTDLDGGGRIYGAIWDRFSQEIRTLLRNRFVFQPFWRYPNGEPGYEDWARALRIPRYYHGRTKRIRGS